MLEQLKLFFAEMLVAVIQCILIVGGSLLILLDLDKALLIIPFTYIVNILCALIFAILYLSKNKAIKINIFKPVKVKLTKSEISIIIRMTATEFVWQVGYTILGYAILKNSEIFYNQYAYLENVLDIFNGLYFAFVPLVSIDICRRLGEGNFDEAYKTGKFSIISTITIWLIYLVLGLAFSYPIIIGMSAEIQGGAFISLILYIVLYLFRFMSWTLFTYVLPWGGKLKFRVWQEIVITLYYICFFFIAKFIPINIYLIYSIIAFPPIIQTILGLIFFKRKTWMQKLSSGRKKRMK